MHVYGYLLRIAVGRCPFICIWMSTGCWTFFYYLLLPIYLALPYSFVSSSSSAYSFSCIFFNRNRVKYKQMKRDWHLHNHRCHVCCGPPTDRPKILSPKASVLPSIGDRPKPCTHFLFKYVTTHNLCCSTLPRISTIIALSFERFLFILYLFLSGPVQCVS